MTENRFSAWDAASIFLGGVIFFTLGLWNQEIIGFESRFYLFALEMLRHGLSGFPTTYGEPYPDYPVTSTLFIYLTAKLVGTLNKWVAVFPSAVAAALTLSLTYLMGALKERRLGWYSVGFLLFTSAFITAARTISLDMYVTVLTTGIFYIAYRATLQEKTPSWFMIGTLLAVSFSIRGPIGIVIPTGVLSIFFLLEKQWKSWVVLSLLSVVLLFVCTGILLSVAYHVGGDSFMKAVLNMEIAGRMEVNRTPPFYFYFVESMGAYALTYPLAILFLMGAIPKKIKKDGTFLRALIGWVLIIMIGLSIPADKKIRYILPIAPALALISAYFLVNAHSHILLWLKKIVYLFCWILPCIVLSMLCVLYYKHIALNYGVLFLIFVMLQLFMLRSRKESFIFFLAVATFFLAHVLIIEKINLDSNQTARFVQRIEQMREKQHVALGFYREGKDGFAIKYLADMQHEENPLFIDDIQKAPPRIFLITSEEHFNALPERLRKSCRLIGSGKIGRDDVLVFQFNKLAIRPGGAS